jgi:hypothetical protein
MPLTENRRLEMEDLLHGETVLNVWELKLAEGEVLSRILLSAEQIEPLLDRLEKRFANCEGSQVILLPVEAAVPRPESPDAAASAPKAAVAAEPKPKAAHIRREELYADIADGSRLSTVHVVMAGLSTIVAVIGQLRNSVALEIGAMAGAAGLFQD